MRPAYMRISDHVTRYWKILDNLHVLAKDVTARKNIIVRILKLNAVVPLCLQYQSLIRHSGQHNCLFTTTWPRVSIPYLAVG